MARETQLEQDRPPSVNKTDLDHGSDVLEKLQKCIVDAVLDQQCTNYRRNTRSNTAGRGRGRGREELSARIVESGATQNTCAQTRGYVGVLEDTTSRETTSSCG